MQPTDRIAKFCGNYIDILRELKLPIGLRGTAQKGAKMRDNETVETLKERVRDLESALGQRNDALANTFKLTPKLNNLLGLLLALPIVKGDLIQQRLGIASDSKVAKHRLNKALALWGIKVHSKRLVGYWISDEDKARIKAMITPEGNDAPVEPVTEATEQVTQAAA